MLVSIIRERLAPMLRQELSTTTNSLVCSLSRTRVWSSCHQCVKHTTTNQITTNWRQHSAANFNDQKTSQLYSC